MFISRAQGRQAWAGQGLWHWELRWPERRPRHTPHCSRAGREEGNRRQALPCVFSGQTGGHRMVTRNGGQTDDQAGEGKGSGFPGLWADPGSRRLQAMSTEPGRGAWRLGLGGLITFSGSAEY